MLEVGTLPQWGTFLGVIAGLIGLATVYVRGIPQRVRANSEANQATNADYLKQIEGFRADVHSYKNEVMGLQGQLRKVEAALLRAESGSRLRADRITNMTFIIKLLISELRRLDPNSIIVAQAEALLLQMEAAELPITSAETKAHDTVKAAQATVSELAHERGE